MGYAVDLVTKNGKNLSFLAGNGLGVWRDAGLAEFDD
jgi:hypothetical protein